MAETIRMPKLGFDMAEGVLVRWIRKEGESINKGDILAEIETDKATVEVESSFGGVVRKLLVDEGTTVPVNTAIAIVGTAEEVIEEPSVLRREENAEAKGALVEAKEKLPTLQSEGLPIPSIGFIKASPLAKRIARERGVELSQIRGSGPGGRIVRRDIEAALLGGSRGKVEAIPGIQAGTDRPLVTGEIPLSKLRQAIARRMSEAKATVPHFYISCEYKMDSLLDLRGQMNGIHPEAEKVSVNDFIVKAAALSLKQFPNLNASFAGEKLKRYGQINIGIAVAVEGGLLTVVCKNADQKSVRQIANEARAMAGRARDGKVKSEDIEGSTFSVSNLGMYEVENFIAIINPPEAAILAVGTAREMAISENGIIKSGWRMKATISVDHRVSDGAEAARFMKLLRVYLEEPLRLILPE